MGMNGQNFFLDDLG